MNADENPYETPSVTLNPTATSKSFATTLLKSFGCMIVWPLIGMWLARNVIEHPNHWFMPFGGATTLLLMPVLVGLGIGGNFSDVLLTCFLMAVWLLILAIPVLGVHRRRWNPKGMLILQSFISFTQALLGTLLLFSRMQ